MSEGISVDLGSALPYMEEKILAMLGRDAETQDLRAIIDRHLRFAIRDAATVQVIGMDEPLSIFDIYQPVALRRLYREQYLEADDLIRSQTNAIVFGGPGYGKTILAHHLFASLARSELVTPLLFTLRRSGCGEDLRRLVDHVTRKPASIKKQGHLLLLVDGLDEISYQQRIDVAAALRDFAACGVGSFILTCRSYYVVPEVQAQYLEVTPFTTEYAERFIRAFSNAYGTAIDAAALLRDLHARGLHDFATHPLLLTMVCILKAGPMPELPRSTVELMRRAIDTLTFRWDEARGIYRESRLRFDGHDRLRCLTAIAYQMKKLIERNAVVEGIVTRYLKLMHRTEVDPGGLLRELAQWYGILVPIANDWTFVHRTLHDFLAAKCWVETGRFNPTHVVTWNSRAAYAACLQPSATRSIVTALEKSKDLSAVIEILYNQPPFDPAIVADAFAKHFEHRSGQYSVHRTSGRWVAATKVDFFPAAPNDLLIQFVAHAASDRAAPRIMLAAYALGELKRRRVSLPPDVARAFGDVYGPKVSFTISRADFTVEMSADMVGDA